MILIKKWIINIIALLFFVETIKRLEIINKETWVFITLIITYTVVDIIIIINIFS